MRNAWVKRGNSPKINASMTTTDDGADDTADDRSFSKIKLRIVKFSCKYMQNHLYSPWNQLWR